MSGSTLEDHRAPAVVCRERGWDVGQHLVGDEGYGPTVIRITAIGEREILAADVSHNGRRGSGIEGSWYLSARDWQPCEAPS